MTPYGYPGQLPPNQQLRTRRVRRRRRRFRWYLLWVPLVLLAWGWTSQGVDPAVSWDAVMSALGVRNRAGLTQLTTLGVIICAALAIVRVIRRRRDDQ